MRRGLLMALLFIALFTLAMAPATLAEDAVPRASSVTINSTNFPDSIFRQYVKAEFDANGDGKLSSTEIASVKAIELVEVPDMKTMKGVEYFTSLEELYIEESSISSIDVSKLTKLKRLGVWGCELTKLNITSLVNLTYLECSCNSLTSLDISKNTNLEYLSCTYNNLTKLDVSKNINLQELWCGGNKLTSLNVSTLTKLDALGCYDNALTSLDMTKNTYLTWLDFDMNSIKTIDLSMNANLTYLNCSMNKLTSLNISKCTKLERLISYDNSFTTLDISNCPNLVTCVQKGTYEVNHIDWDNYYLDEWDPYGEFNFTAVGYIYDSDDYDNYTVCYNSTVKLTYNALPAADFVLPAKLTTIQTEAFRGGAMTMVICPNTLKSIGAKAFMNCTKLKGIYIPASVTSIAPDAFSGCSGFTIYAPSGSVAEVFAENKDYDYVAYTR
ncbi:MAG: hypothetical protein E7317_00235 [Clostridiales bacterium]|nr:hypothetical protein [Clostridiales bacterium]